MKNKTLFIIVIFVAALFNTSHLVAQSENKPTACNFQAVEQNNSDEIFHSST